MPAKLTAKQDMFCREYLVDLNATQAAIRAGYSQKTAVKIGHENLTKLDIQNRIKELMAGRGERLQIDADWVLQKAVELHDLAKEAREFNPALKAVEIVAKHVNVNAFNKDQDQSNNITPEQLAKLSPEELQKLKVAQDILNGLK